MLACRNGERDSLTIRAHLLDPGRGLDGPGVVTIEDGVVTAVESVASAPAGLVLAPAFVDPHVHLRTPGREDEETIASGTAAAAAGGYCAIVAMPNTEPGRRHGPRAPRAARAGAGGGGRPDGVHRRDLDAASGARS